MRFLSVVPQDVRGLFDQGQFMIGNFTVFNNVAAQSAAKLLVTDRRMTESWSTLREMADPSFSDDYGQWAQSFISTVAYQYSEAIREKRRWQNMTVAEQERWLHDFLSTSKKIVELIDSGPWPITLAKRLIYAGDYEKQREQELAKSIERNLVGDEEEAEADCTLLIETNFEVGLFGGIPKTDLRNVLCDMVDEQITMTKALRQSLKKPRDAHAGRARFLQELTKWCMRVCDAKLQEVVATTAAVVFADEAIGVRLVQIHTRGI